MIIKVDPILAEEFGTRPLPDGRTRHYHSVPEYPRLLLRTDLPLEQLNDRISVAKINRGDDPETATNGRIICEQFPNAPSAWSSGGLIQVSLMPPPKNWRNRVNKRQGGNLPSLSEFLAQEFGTTPKRTITPHKGGRTISRRVSMTPEIFEAAKELGEQGHSYSDIFEYGVRVLSL